MSRGRASDHVRSRVPSHTRSCWLHGLTLPVLLGWLGPWQRHLQVLYGASGWVVSWGGAPRLVLNKAAWRLPAGTARRIPARGWPELPQGGVIAQLPYEWTSRPYGAPDADGRSPARYWPMRIVIASDDTDDSDGAVGRVRVSAPAGLLGRLVAQLRRLIAGRAVPDVAGLASTCRGGGLELTSQLADLQRRYAEMIRSTQAHIAAGRCYQLNCTVPVTARLRRSGLLSRRVSADDIRLWLAMLPDQAMQSGQQSRKLGHTGGYAAVLRWPGRSVVSLSPECLVQADHGRIWTMPIKGSRPPSQGAELTEAEKDAAELAMIVDLARNDLGRLAHVGSVQVDGPETLVLDYIHHREATVSARLRTGQTWRDIFCALFPAGSITGAPKAAAMRHLRDLEQRLRGAYCGSIGWLAQGIHGPIGACSVAIRTAEVHADQVRWQAGGGIVSDSDPDAEWHEVEVKSTPFFRLVDGGSVAKPD